MIKNIEEQGNILFVEVTDMITKEDVESVIPTLEKMIEKYKKIKSLVIMNKLKGYTFGGFLADFDFYLKHQSSFDYMAIVGDKEFEKAIIELLSKLMPGKAKYFDISETDKAKEWIQQA